MKSGVAKEKVEIGRTVTRSWIDLSRRRVGWRSQRPWFSWRGLQAESSLLRERKNELLLLQMSSPIWFVRDGNSVGWGFQRFFRNRLVYTCQIWSGECCNTSEPHRFCLVIAREALWLGTILQKDSLLVLHQRHLAPFFIQPQPFPCVFHVWG